MAAIGAGWARIIFVVGIILPGVLRFNFVDDVGRRLVGEDDFHQTGHIAIHDQYIGIDNLA